jgi:transposase
LYQGNPSDKTLLAPIVKRFKKLLDRTQTANAADKGYYPADNLTRLKDRYCIDSPNAMNRGKVP